MPTLSNGQWVDENHPLYAEDQKKQQAAQTPAPVMGEKTNAVPRTGNEDERDTRNAWLASEANRSQTNPAASANNVIADEQPTPYGDDMRTGVETQGQPPGVTPTGGPDFASIYKQSFGTDATPEQLAWFATQDPTAMVAHIQGMGAQQKPAATTGTTANPWVPETMNGMAGYRNPTTGQWVPGDSPLATGAGNPSVNPNGGQPTPGAPGSGAGGSGSYTPPNSAPGTPGTTPVNTQAANASTYSQTPGADPDAATTNQGTQDVWRNKLLEMATQSTDVDTNDPTFRNQADAFRAASSRAARELQADQAVASGPTGQAFARGQQRLTAANAQQQQGSFEAQLAGRELQNKRDEIKMALSSLGAGIENDQRRALEAKLGELNASIQKLGIETGASTAAAELALKDKLGMGGLNVDLMRALLQNRQFGDELGFNIADREAFYNNSAAQALLG